jgi:hypothetical protein
LGTVLLDQALLERESAEKRLRRELLPNKRKGRKRLSRNVKQASRENCVSDYIRRHKNKPLHSGKIGVEAQGIAYANGSCSLTVL